MPIHTSPFTDQASSPIQYAVGTSWLGRTLVAKSPTGICAILLADNTDALQAELQKQFPNDAIVKGGPDMELTLAAVLEFMEAPAPVFPMPVDLRGTQFQREVWNKLAEIPPGQTLTYTQLAQRLGAGPSAVRAVAGACAANALAVAIPCHRAVKNDGSLAGFRWGLERKRALLEREGNGIIGRANPGAVHQLSLFS